MPSRVYQSGQSWRKFDVVLLLKHIINALDVHYIVRGCVNRIQHGGINHTEPPSGASRQLHTADDCDVYTVRVLPFISTLTPSFQMRSVATGVSQLETCLCPYDYCNSSSTALYSLSLIAFLFLSRLLI